MKTTVSTLKKQKENKEKITMLTCYDYSMAKLMDEAGIEILLIPLEILCLGMTLLYRLPWKI